MKVAHLGDEYSHTFAAVRRLCGEVVSVGRSTVRGAALAVVNGECDACVLPVENSTEGAVTATADVLVELPLFVRAQTAMTVHHDLIASEGANLKDIDTVYSHPQALAQCAKWLEKNLPGARRIAVSSTSQALGIIRGANQAAIARAPCPGQRSLEARIEDCKDNTTRFWLLSKVPGSHGRRFSVIFGAKDRPGGLLSVLRLFEKAEANMTRIESRPSKKALGEYIFFADFFHEDAEKAENLLKELKANTDFTKFLGRYDDIENMEAETDLWD